jgi:hypothetical protein
VNSVNVVPFRPYGVCKIACNVYLDDRAVAFSGRWTKKLTTEILQHRAWWEGRDRESFKPIEDAK